MPSPGREIANPDAVSKRLAASLARHVEWYLNTHPKVTHVQVLAALECYRSIYTEILIDKQAIRGN